MPAVGFFWTPWSFQELESAGEMVLSWHINSLRSILAPVSIVCVSLSFFVTSAEVQSSTWLASSHYRAKLDSMFTFILAGSY